MRQHEACSIDKMAGLHFCTRPTQMFNNINKEYKQLLIYPLDILCGENESIISNITSNVSIMLTNYMLCL